MSLTLAVLVALVSSVTTGAQPAGAVRAQDAARLYVASQEGSISVIDPATFQETDRLQSGWTTNTLAVAPTRHRLYVTVAAQEQFVAYDTDTRARVATMYAPGWANGTVISPDESVAYVSGFHSGQVHAYDLQRNVLVKSVTLPDNPEPVDMKLAGGRLYVAGSRVPLVHVLDAGTMQYLGSIPVISDMLGVRGLDIDSRGRYLYTLSREGTIVTAVRLSDWAVVASRVIGTSDGDVNTGRDGIVVLGGKVYSTVGSQTYVEVLSAKTLRPRDRLPLPAGCGYPADMTGDGRDRLYVSCVFDSAAAELDVRTGATRLTTVGALPVGLAFG